MQIRGGASKIRGTGPRPVVTNVRNAVPSRGDTDTHFGPGANVELFSVNQQKVQELTLELAVRPFSHVPLLDAAIDVVAVHLKRTAEILFDG
jgi:hypothetical protein